MVDRIQLTDTVYMNLDGQWQIVYPGSVIDVPSHSSYSSQHKTVLSPATPAGTLGPHGKATSISGIRRR